MSTEVMKRAWYSPSDPNARNVTKVIALERRERFQYLRDFGGGDYAPMKRTPFMDAFCRGWGTQNILNEALNAFEIERDEVEDYL